MKFHHSILAHVTEGWKNHRKKILITTGTGVLVVLVIAGGSYGYVEAFEGKVYPNVKIGSINVGGKTQAEANEAVQAAYNGMLDRGAPVRLVANDVNKLSVIDLRASGSTDPDLVYDLVSMNVDKATDEALNAGRESDNAFVNTLNALYTLAVGKTVDVETTINQAGIDEAIKKEFESFEQPGEQTNFDIEIDGDDVTVDVTEGTIGYTIDSQEVVSAIAEAAQQFQINEIQIGFTEMQTVTKEMAEQLVEGAQAAILSAPYTLTYESEKQFSYDWEISREDIADWIYPAYSNDGKIELALDVEAMEEFLDGIREDVDVEAQNARFAMEDGRVVEFAGSLNGVTLDEEMTLKDLIARLGEEDVELAISVETVEPEVTTNSVNSLGITEIVGVGTSNFAGSPANRRSNIKHGADKLNGLLIAPGEEFSLVKALSPFTIADGWLPELVIKDDEIKPEVGGGACQFGTTLFRAAMNTGLEITQRRNHSLVVSYYDDPSNGNPGTDATIYDPSPDLRFVNDTEDYLLLTTEVNFETADMIFTFWGTSDGRKGYYTPPEILSWSGYGATVEKETDSLAPGVRRCQAAHAGATTSFDYIVEYADGETFEHNYTSVYRSLPQICLVGKSDGGDSEQNTGDITQSEENDEPLDVEDVPVEEEEI